jgi:hypothetical protein
VATDTAARITLGRLTAGCEVQLDGKTCGSTVAVVPGRHRTTLVADGRVALIASDGSTVAVSSTDRATGTAELVKLSLFSTASIEDIAASALDLDGKLATIAPKAQFRHMPSRTKNREGD